MFIQGYELLFGIWSVERQQGFKIDASVFAGLGLKLGSLIEGSWKLSLKETLGFIDALDDLLDICSKSVSARANLIAGFVFGVCWDTDV